MTDLNVGKALTRDTWVHVLGVLFQHGVIAGWFIYR